MDNESYIRALDIYHINVGEMIKRISTISINEELILTDTYDDVNNIKQSELPFYILRNLSLPNQDTYQCTQTASRENRFGCWKRHFIVLLALIAGVAFIVLSYKLNITQDVSSSTSYPVINPDICDAADSYDLSSWFVPSSTKFETCDLPIQISEIYIQRFSVSTTFELDCQSKLGCVSVIGVYLIMQSENCEYNFFVDHNSNVYAARDWLCPYISGQLRVGIITDSSTFMAELEEMKRILQHFNNEITSYAVKFNYFSTSGLHINYINKTRFIR